MDNRAYTVNYSRRRFWLLALAIAIFATGLAAFVRYREFLFPSRTAHLIYNHYAGDSTLHSAYVLNYKLDDTLVVDVTVLQATTDSAWNLIERDLIALPEGTICYFDTTKPITKITHLQPYDDSCVVSAIYAQKTVYIFSSDKKEVFGNILFKIFDVSTKQRPKTNKFI